MILAGLMSLVQVCWLPGFLLLQFFPVRGRLARALLGFAFSLLANYQIVLILAASGLYRRPVVLALFAAELAAAGWIVARRAQRAQRAQPPAPASDATWREPIAECPRALPVRYLLPLAAGLTPLWLMRFWLPKIPGVFNKWDDLCSWNVWAVEWAHNTLPQWCRWYPQLMTANWSLTYVFTAQSSVHFFAKAFMGFFAVGLLLLFLPIARATRSLAAVFAVPVCGYLLLFLFGGLIGEGYADLPVAFFTLAAFLAFELGWEGQLSTGRAVILVSLLAAGAAVTKQAGLYTLLAALGGNAALAVRARLPRAQTLALGAVFATMTLFGVAPWYLREGILLAHGQNRSEFHYQTSELYEGRPPLARIPAATSGIAGSLLRLKAPASVPLTGAMLTAFAVIGILAWRRQLGRSALIFSVPFYFLWAAYFSYDQRNIALAVPFLALVIAVGAFEIAEILRRLCAVAAASALPRARFAPAIVLCIVVAIGVWADRRWPAEILNRRQDLLLRQAGGPELNAALYDFARSHGFRGSVLTNYEILGQLPELAHLYRRYHFEIGEDIEALRARLASAEDPVGYLLVPDYAAPRLRQYIDGHHRKVFWAGEWTLYEVLNDARLNSAYVEVY